MRPLGSRAGAQTVSPAALPAAVLAAGLGLAAIAAASAYLIGPATMPLMLVAVGAGALGLWRLEYGIAALIVLTPLAENAPITDPGDAPLRVALTVWLLVLALIELGRQLVSSERLHAPPLLGPALLFLLVTLISLALAVNVTDAGASYMAIVGTVALYLLIAMRLTSWERVRPILIAIVGVGIAISAHAIWQYATGDLSPAGSFLSGGEVEQRIKSTFTHPNQLGGYLAIMVAIGAGLTQAFQDRGARIAAFLMTALAIVATVLTFSRGALVAIAALGLLYAGTRRAWPLLVGGVVALFLLAPSTLGERLSNIGDPQSSEVATRVDLWQAGLQMFAEDPVAGVGLNSYASSYVALERSGRTFLGSGSPFAVPESAHNLYVNTLAEQGLIGFAALVLLLLLAVRMALGLRRSPERTVRGIGMALLGALVVGLVHGMFDLTIFDPKVSVLVWAMLGIGAAATRFEPVQRRS